MKTVDFELIKKIRNHITRTEKQAILLPERKKWLQLTAALDVLEDTSWAVEYYIENEYPTDVKGKYLFTYGLLQAIFVQLDAVSSIQESLFGPIIDYKQDYPDVYRVREMRDDVTGHPTSRRKHQFNHLAQISMNKNGFYYLRSDSNAAEESDEIIRVSISKAIEDVSTCINETLEKAVASLDEEFQIYIKSHRDRKMKEIFNALHYAKEKALFDTMLSDYGYNITKNMVKKCEDELIQRYGSVEAVDCYNYLLADIHELYDLIDDGLSQMPSEIRSKSKKYFLECLFAKLEQLACYAEETDDYFEHNGQI